MSGGRVEIKLERAIELRRARYHERLITLEAELQAKHFAEWLLFDPERRLLSNCELEPPRLAEFVVAALIRQRYREPLLSDLEETFHHHLAAGMTPRRARLRYWAAAINSIGPQLWAAVKRIGIIGLLLR